MRKKINIQIAEPCNENWEEMTTTERGAFCNSCERDLFDFTKMTDIELVHFFTKNTDNVCGRYKENQLNRNITLDTSFNFSRFYKYFLSMFLVFGGFNKAKATVENEVHFIENLNSDNDRISDSTLYKGNVKDIDGNDLSFIKIVVYNTNGDILKSTATDKNGNYELYFTKDEISTITFVKISRFRYNNIDIPRNDFLRNENARTLTMTINIDNHILGMVTY